jgi:hypothetical protein
VADLTTGKIPKAIGATQIGDSIITDNGAAGIAIAGALSLAGATSGTLSLRAPPIAGASIITFPVGTTNFPATGGPGQVLQQATLGGPITVGALAAGSIGGLGAGVATWLATPSSANLAAAVTGETGTGALVFATSPTLVTPVLGAATGTSLAVSGLLQAGTTLGISTDVLLARTGANSLALRNGASPQSFRAYNTYTDASNGEWAYLGDWSANVARYGTDKNGTGVARSTYFLSGGVIAGMLDASAQWVFGGNIGAGARLSVLGTYTTANLILVDVFSTMASSGTASQWGFYVRPTFAPSGASLSNLYSLFSDPTLAASAVPITAFNGVSSRLTLTALYTAVPPSTNLFLALDPVLNGNAPFALLTGYAVAALTNGNGLTTGAVQNRGINISAITAGAAGGTLNNRGILLNVPNGGASSGAANNYGLYITGNGGTASGSGTVVNMAIISDSTAPSLITGAMTVTGGITVGTTTLLTTNATLSNAAAAATATLTNAPVAGNPTKWISINDNGTIRRLPAW